MITAVFDSCCGESATNFGVFDSIELLEIEYDKMKNLIMNLGEGNKIFNHKSINEVTINKVIELDGHRYILVTPILYITYDIDVGPAEDERETMQDGDFLLINMETIEDEEIEFVYLIRNKFVCGSETHNYFSQQDIIQYYPHLLELK